MHISGSNVSPAREGSEAEARDEILARRFEYLDALRKPGIINMFGARPYLAWAFGIPLSEAGEILSAWMKSDLSVPAIDRARASRLRKGAQ